MNCLRRFAGAARGQRQAGVPISLWPRDSQYNVGYGKFKDLMNELEAKAGGLFSGGHYRKGFPWAIPSCPRQARTGSKAF